MSTDWDAWFAWMPKINPLNEQRRPMADHECRDCGQLECDCRDQQRIEEAA